MASVPPGMGAGSAPELRELVYRLVLRDRSRPPALLFQIVPASPTLRVETIATNIAADGDVWRLVQVRGTKRELDEAERLFRVYRSATLRAKRVVGRGPCLLVLWYKYSPEHERGPSLTRLALAALGPETVITDRSTETGLEVRILTPAGARLQRFLPRLERAAAGHHDFTILYLGPPRFQGLAGLSPEEERALTIAQASGFFEVPRRGSMRTLATALGCSPSAASARLRRATTTLLRLHLGT